MIRQWVEERIEVAIAELGYSGLPRPEVAEPRQPEHGHFATNFALIAAKSLGLAPPALAERLADQLRQDLDLASVEVAGPGFLNLRLTAAAHATFLPRILAEGEAFGRTVAETPKRINVEFVSVNPNGPITIGSGRGAAFGSTLCNVLEAAGHQVHREYYINDGVNSEQMRLFAESVRAIVLEQPIPDRGYKGDYVEHVGHELLSLSRPYRLALVRPLVYAIRRLRDGAYHHESVAPFATLVAPHARIQHLFDELERHEAIEHAIDFLQDVAEHPDAEGQLSLDQIRDAVRRLPVEHLQSVVQEFMVSRQREGLDAFETSFDTWFSEQSLHDSGRVAECLAELERKGVADQRPTRTKLKLGKGGKLEDVETEDQPVDDDDAREGLEPTLWLRSTRFGDDQDRVLRRRDGRLTYIASDVAYHDDKFNRPANAEKLITVLGPDHHGYIGRLTAVVAALGSEPARGGEPVSGLEARLYADTADREACHAALRRAQEQLEVVIFQLVRFVKDGQPAPMRKRDGNIYALIDLIDEIGTAALPDAPQAEQRRLGRDVARYFYLMRSHDTTMDFDLNLAARQSEDNPVFYVQYAHARICSILSKAAEEGFAASTQELALLDTPEEMALIRKIADLPHEVARCADDYGVHRLTTYATELARTFHHFYGVCRVVDGTAPARTSARLTLCEATALSLRTTFRLLGISAPERM